MAISRLANDISVINFADYEKATAYTFDTPYGLSYNVGVLHSGEICLVNLPSFRFAAQLLSLLSTEFGGMVVKFIVLQHVDYDVAVSLYQIAAAFPGAQVLAVRKALEFIELFDQRLGMLQSTAVDESTELLFPIKLRFIRTPLVKWPDSLAVFALDAGVLFTDLIFSYTGSSDNPETVRYYAARFCANMFNTRNPRVRNFLQQTKASKVVVPLHGSAMPMGEALEAYDAGGVEKTVICIYQSMYGSTERAVTIFSNQLYKSAVNVVLFDMQNAQLSYVAYTAGFAIGIIAASPTLNGDAMPGVLLGLSYLKYLNSMQGKLGFVLGSFGWDGGEAQRKMTLDLQEMGVYTMGSITWKFNFGEDIAEQIRRYASELAAQIRYNFGY